MAGGAPLSEALLDAVRKLDPRAQWRNPVMFVVWAGSVLTTLLFFQALGGKGEAPAAFIGAIAAWLWFTVLFANFAEALAEGRSKAQAASLRGLKRKVLAKTANETPPDATHWSVRTMAKAVGISRTSVQRIWAEAGLKPHLVKRFKISNDPAFEEKVTDDVVGLYMNPPDRALVLGVDEKSQIQALDRTQPGLPLKKGRAATMTHDYKRHGTTTLYAALDVRTGLVIGDCKPRHRAREFIAFLKLIDGIVDDRFALHLVVDNYGAHKTAAVKAWLAKHPRFHLHFTPTSASWLNLVERFFAEITRKRIRRGAFASVADLEAAIRDYLASHNANPKPFVWSKRAHTILEKERRAFNALEAIKAGYQPSESEH